MISKRRLAKGILAGPLLAACLWPVAGSAQSRVIDGCARGATSKLVLNVKDKGARGDGKTNDTAAIQAVLDKAAGTGGTVLVPDGTYMVDATVRLYPRHDTMLQLSQGATLKVIPNGATHYGVIAVAAPNVIVDGGTLEGDRDQHQGTAGEYGYGVHVLAGAENATIRGVTARKMWGDGFFVDGARNVSICSVIADRNRRQGLSVIEVDGLLVTDSVFSNTHGTAPGAGIDMEPNENTEQIKHVRVVGSKFLDNEGAGILIYGRKGADNISDVEISRNLFTGALPIKIKYAPRVLDSAICRNRQILPPRKEQAQLSSSPFVETAAQVVHQSECGDPRLRIRY